LLLECARNIQAWDVLFLEYSGKKVQYTNSNGDDDNKPVWPTWAVGALFWGVRSIHVSHV
jgi:hypothetical protein